MIEFVAPELDIETVTEIFHPYQFKGVVLSQDFAMSKIAGHWKWGQRIAKSY